MLTHTLQSFCARARREDFCSPWWEECKTVRSVGPSSKLQQPCLFVKEVNAGAHEQSSGVYAPHIHDDPVEELCARRLYANNARHICELSDESGLLDEMPAFSQFVHPTGTRSWSANLHSNRAHFQAVFEPAPEAWQVCLDLTDVLYELCSMKG